MSRYFRRVGLALLGVAAFVVIGITLENKIHLPFSTSYRVACAAISLFLIWKFRSDYPEDNWPKISLWVALLVNIGIFLTPLVDRPPSRGELMLFALPDTIIVLVARIATYPVIDAHQRSVRQQMTLGLIIATGFCVGIYAAILIPRVGH